MNDVQQADIAYCGLMDDARRRIVLLRRIIRTTLPHGSETFDYECASLQLRKLLEAIAFGSLCANKAAYAKAHKGFERHSRTKDIVRLLEKINASFYPTPVRRGQPRPGVDHHLEPIERGYLTKSEFVQLYDTCNEVLHLWNPFRQDPRRIDFARHLTEWTDRIERLLTLHLMYPAGSNDVLVVELRSPVDGKAHAYRATPN